MSVFNNCKQVIHIFKSFIRNTAFLIIRDEADLKKKIKGVWALFGKNDELWYCLQVGQSNDIMKEIKADICLLEKDLTIAKNEQFYINQFKEKVFKYSFLPTLREQLYKNMKDNYYDLIFIYVEIKDVAARKEIESYFAKSSQAIYWRNGRPFESGNKFELKQSRFSICDESKDCDSIKNNISTILSRINNENTPKL